MRHLLLDFGGVVLLTPFELRAQAEASLGLEPGTLRWAGPFDPSTDALWRELQAGRCTERSYWASRAAEHDLDTLGFMRHFYDPGGDHLVRSEVVALAAQVRDAGRRVGILTNDLQAFHGPAWMRTISFLGAVDALVDASVTGILKPDPRAFRSALDALGVPASEVVFVDDQPVNVAGADEVGLVAVWFDVTDPVGSVARARAAVAG